MQIDKTRRDDHRGGVDDFRGFVRLKAADFCDASVLDSEVAAKAWQARSVNDHPVLGHGIEFRHFLVPSIGSLGRQPPKLNSLRIVAHLKPPERGPFAITD